MPIDLYLTMIVRLTAGILAIAAPGKPISVERATEYAVAASYQGQRTGVDPFELIAIARNESDFEEHVRGPDGKDCGLTQTRITITHYTCRQLLRSYWLAFQEAAREMKEYTAACKGHRDFDRCRLNRYNSGVRYAKTGFHGAYWLRTMCFAEAARRGVPVADLCRHVEGKRDIARVLLHAAPPAKSLKVAGVVPSRPSS